MNFNSIYQEYLILFDTIPTQYSLNTPLEHHPIDWTNAALYAGMVEWAELAGRRMIAPMRSYLNPGSMFNVSGKWLEFRVIEWNI